MNESRFGIHQIPIALGGNVKIFSSHNTSRYNLSDSVRGRIIPRIMRDDDKLMIIGWTAAGRSVLLAHDA